VSDRRLLVPTAGVTALTSLTSLTRLALTGDGFGIAELVLKARALAMAGRFTACHAVPQRSCQTLFRFPATVESWHR
jgi:hypothetical protein